MSLFPISTARGLIGQPVMAFNWEMIIPDPPAVVAPYVQSLSLKVRTAAIPGVQQEGYDTQFGPFVYVHPGRKSYSRRVTLSFEEGYSKPVVEAFKLWSSQILDEEGGIGVDESDNKANMWLRLLGPNPEGNVQGISGAVHVYHAFPFSVNDTALSYSEEGQVMVNVVMAFNVWRWESWPF